MQSRTEPTVSVQPVEERFPTECPDCSAPLRGVLIRQELLTAEDIVEIFGSVVSLRTAKAWLRQEWARSFRLPGMRHRVVSAREFVAAIEERKRQPGRGRRPLRGRGPRRTLSTSCPRCEAALQGFIAPLQLLRVPDILLLGGKLRHAAVEAWIRSGLVRGFKLPGVRGLLVEVGDFSDDFEVLKRRSARGAAHAIRPIARGES